jgi:hypothetical protein
VVSRHGSARAETERNGAIDETGAPKSRDAETGAFEGETPDRELSGRRDLNAANETRCHRPVITSFVRALQTNPQSSALAALLNQRSLHEPTVVTARTRSVSHRIHVWQRSRSIISSPPLCTHRPARFVTALPPVILQRTESSMQHSLQTSPLCWAPLDQLNQLMWPAEIEVSHFPAFTPIFESAKMHFFFVYSTNSARVPSSFALPRMIKLPRTLHVSHAVTLSRVFHYFLQCRIIF